MNIDRLLDFESQALFSIFTYLKENSGFHDINEISEQVGFEKRTTLKYLERLASLSDEVENQLGIPPLIVSERMYQISREHYTENKELSLAIYHISIKINLLEGLLSNKANTMASLMEKYNLSYSTLKKDVYEVRDYLKEVEIELHIRNGELVLSGLEPAIRLFFLSFFWQLYGGYGQPFELDSSTEKNFIFEKLSFLLSDHIDPITKLQYDYLVDITLIRYLAGHKIENNELPIESILIGNKFVQHFHFITEENVSAYEHFKDELYFILLFLQSKMVFYRNDQFFQELKKYHQLIDSNIFQANQFFFQNIGLLFNEFHFDHDELEKELYVVHTRLLFKSFYNHVPIGEYYNLYPEDMAIVQENLRLRLENIHSRNSLIYSQLDYAIFLYAAISLANEFMTGCEISVFIDDSQGEFNSIWLKNFFTESTKGLVKLTFVDPNRFLLADNSVDLVISTNKFFPIENAQNKPILFLECKDKYEDLKIFHSMIRKIMIEKTRALQPN
ncbi:helix-turn-helix domain-containing protein [Enterococcus dongliensis]|uniref:helix-turn-helix domain-containing protein n=1 Tax=Enterococcus dongliensis TaxID=2559925 RepID=UPI00288FB4AE|nr:helix-turn-helix domain-containing protein [Enterococcus dongliensis]MDT2604127.1 helix-turn-helix domain-containing protein [Enterococcus dongliensis]MDT2645071.1 helix-turn-helix domain-containing protein [Enterococcus dongliensis]MDT2671532.1 helix-turn-helix domain-containing protein [Enterococcus dongliensis]